ncbi:MAG: type II toxin-antitoxin system VapC family toxin [Chloroflexi bacterium]|nr:type II toxin-antitoxin system VapC family toxin [Chloroflexota bacterium]
MADKPVFVLDGFALLAYLQGEAGMERVQKALEKAEKGQALVTMSIVNLGEVLYIIEREKGLSKAHEVLSVVQQLPLQIIPADNQTVLAAAHIKANHALSYADAFAVICAQSLGGIVLTGDKEFESVNSLVSIEWLPR